MLLYALFAVVAIRNKKGWAGFSLHSWANFPRALVSSNKANQGETAHHIAIGVKTFILWGNVKTGKPKAIDTDWSMFKAKIQTCGHSRNIQKQTSWNWGAVSFLEDEKKGSAGIVLSRYSIGLIS